MGAYESVERVEWKTDHMIILFKNRLVWSSKKRKTNRSDGEGIKVKNLWDQGVSNDYKESIEESLQLLA